ncbi:MAG: transporter substrate-binding domain-containing protein [Conchiformibius sp.]|nr:transporter substrate-binding domain-containing protein [Conchiformibius sp.]
MIGKVVAGACAAWLLAGCGGGENRAVQAAPALKTGQVVYRVATDATYPPFEFRNHRGEIIGMDIDLLDAIAADQGFKVEYYHHDWEGMFSQLTGKQADILASAVAVNDESREHADLSEHYYRSPYRVVSLKKENLDKLAWTKKQIAVAANDDTAEDMRERYPIAAGQIHASESLYLSLTALVKGEADSAVGDSTVMQYYMNSPTFKDHGYHFVSDTLPSATPESANLVFAVQKGNTELLSKINAGLRKLKQNGKYDEIMQKWRQSSLKES